MPLTHAEIDAPATPGTGESAAVSCAVPRYGEPPTPGEAVQPVPCIIRGVINLTVSTGTISVTIRVRRGLNTTSGPVVGPAVPHTLASGNAASIPFNFMDATGATDGYTVTVTPNGASATPTVNYSSVDVETL